MHVCKRRVMSGNRTDAEAGTWYVPTAYTPPAQTHTVAVTAGCGTYAGGLYRGDKDSFFCALRFTPSLVALTIAAAGHVIPFNMPRSVEAISQWGLYREKWLMHS